MTLAPVQRSCICDSQTARHGAGHLDACDQAYRALFFSRVADTRAVHAEYGCGHPALTPACEHCGGEGSVMVGVGPVDRLSGQPDGTVSAPCPACVLGDDVAEHRIGWAEFDALSKAALAPAPVSREDFLPASPSRRNEPS
jgi:hypothetical protein